MGIEMTNVSEQMRRQTNKKNSSPPSKEKKSMKLENKSEMESSIPALFFGLCPNCSGEISSERLEKGLPCEKCIPEELIRKELIQKKAEKKEKDTEHYLSVEEIIELLRKTGKLQNFSKIYELEKKAEKFSSFFREVVGFPPWSLQITWAKRVLAGQSFVALAPTGIGKTTFGMTMALFIEGKSYIIMPTKLLSKLFMEKIISSAEKLGIHKKILLVANSNKKVKEEVEKGDFDILITTSMFLARNEELINGKKFDFIFVDDVDTYLKQPKNVERVLRLMGLSHEDIDKLKSLMNEKFSVIRKKDMSVSEKINEFNEISKKIAEIRKKVRGVLVISSATAKARAGTIRYFREIFGFEISPYTTTLRNIEDTYINLDSTLKNGSELDKTKRKLFEKVPGIIEQCGKGGFIFVSAEYGKQVVYELRSFLTEKGIKAITYEEFTPENQEKFRNGEITAVIGISSLRNPLARGIDLPDAVRYSVFVGVPRFVFSLGEVDEPAKMLGVLFTLRNVLGQPRRIYSYIESMKKYAGMRAEDIERYPPIKQRIESIKEFINEKLNDPEVISKIKESEDVPLRVEEDGKFKIVVADSSAYIQCSGRTSRLYVGGLSKGLTVMLVDDRKAFFQLKKRLKIDIVDIEFKEFEKINLKKVLREINRDRRNIRKVIEGKVLELSKTANIKPPKNAVFIVESPNKAGTIARLIGRPTRRKIVVNGNGKTVDAWEVSKGDLNITIIASGGHVFDLPFSLEDFGKKGGEKEDSGDGYYYYNVRVVELRENGRVKRVFIPEYKAIKRCRSCGENFFDDGKCPYCGSTDFDDKADVVKAIREVCMESDLIFIATDPDHEGEKIAWDIFLAIPKFKKEIRRAEYHEVTRKAIFRSMENPRDIDIYLVSAQIIRRVADRWIGFKMSKELQTELERHWLSAGRVQTPVLGWLIEREKQMKEKIGVLTFKGEQYDISDSIRVEDKEKARIISKAIQKLKGRKRKNEEAEKERQENSKIHVSYELIGTEEVELKPAPPMNTSDMLRESSAKLKFSAPETMSLAQQLFEAGLITYHRTDSHHVSDVGISVAKDFVSEVVGDESFFVPRSWEAEGTHECIRPTRNLTPDELRVSARIGTISVSEKAIRLYELIFSRFMASQMKPVKVLKGKIKVNASWFANGDRYELEKISELNLKILEDGWNKAVFLPIPTFAKHLLEKKKISFETRDFKYSLVSPVPPYTQGTLIDEMKKRGIGRPSTWAYIVKTLLDRGYCIERSGFLIITKLGKEVYEYLSKHDKYKIYTSEDYTRQLEERMDKVERREESYTRFLNELFNDIFGK